MDKEKNKLEEEEERHSPRPLYERGLGNPYKWKKLDLLSLVSEVELYYNLIYNVAIKKKV